MPVKVRCSQCETKITAPDKARGRAVACPKCGAKLKIPGAKPAAVAAAGAAGPPAKRDTGEFLANMDLSRVAAADSAVCPKCGADVGEEDVECPACGADLVTGGKGITQRRRAIFKARGEDPAVYYRTAGRDGRSFLGKNRSLAVRTGVLLSVASFVAGLCTLFVLYCHRLPPQLFWGFFALVGTLIPPGVVWVLQEEVTTLTLKKKDRLNRFKYDAFLCVARGLRLALWVLLVPLPFALIAALTAALWKNGMLPQPVVFAALGLWGVAAALLWPVSFTHLCMPVTTPAWRFDKVAAGTARNIGPVFWWFGMTLLAFLPFLAAAGATAAFAAPKVEGLVNTMRANSAAAVAAEAAKNPQGGDGPPMADLDYSALIVPAAALVPLCFLFAFAAVFAARPAGLLGAMFRPSLGTITLTKEVRYERREEKAVDPDALTWQKSFMLVGICAVLGVAAGFCYSMVGDAAILAGVGTGLYFAGSLGAFIAGVSLLVEAFKTGIGWGLAYLFIPLAALVYIALYWERAKYLFVINVGAVLVGLAGLVLIIMSGASLDFLMP